MKPDGIVSRRKLLQAAALTGAASLLPGFVLDAAGEVPAFPPQNAIDSDPLRPRFHLMPKRGWMNDPCAPVYFNGRYHMFFQYNPYASVWGNMSWAHAVSKDMVHWTERPVALERRPGGPDSYGVFTGSMMLDRGVPTALYTCVSPSTQEEATLWGAKPPEREAQCLATPAGNVKGGPEAALDRWSKLSRPVIAAPPPGMSVTGFRDPVPWREDDGSYYLLLASGQQGVGGDVLLYKSPDLRQWEYRGVFAQGRPSGKHSGDSVDDGETWECPDFFPLGGKHVLIHSTGTPTGRATLWQSGTLDKATMKWTPEKEGVLNHGPYYAPKTQMDAEGNRILWGWIPEDRPEAEFAKAGWAGCMSLPRVMTLVDGEVRFSPAPATDGLRGGVELRPNGSQELVEAVFTVSSQGPKNGPVTSSPRLSTPMLVLETAKTPGVRTLRFKGEEISLPDNMPDSFAVRCFVDCSIVEVFFGDAVVLTHRVYDGKPTVITLPSHLEAISLKTFALTPI